MLATVITAALPLLLLFWAVGAYSRLLRLHKQVRHAFVQFGVPLKRRHALILRLIDAFGAQRQREALEAVIAARNHAVAAHADADPADSGAIRRLTASERVLAASLKRLLALREEVDSKADRHIVQLIEELADVERKTAFAQHAYNERVAHYNIALKQFPGLIIAVVFAFRPAEPLQEAEMPQEHGAAAH